MQPSLEYANDENMNVKVTMIMEMNVNPHTKGGQRYNKFQMGDTFSGYFEKKVLGVNVVGIQKVTLHLWVVNLNKPTAIPALSVSI